MTAPDLLAESTLAYQRSVISRSREFGRTWMDISPHIGPWTLTDSYPDPHGPDRVVFGPGPEAA